MQKFARIFSVAVLALAALSIYSYAVVYSATGGKKFGAISETILAFASFPKLVMDVFESDQFSGIPPTFLPIDEEFKEINQLDYDLFAMNSEWDGARQKWVVHLENFRNGERIHEWLVGEEQAQYDTEGRQFPNARMVNPLLTDDMGVVVFNVHYANLMRLDRNSNVLWSNHDKAYHHSVNPDAEGNLWVCASDIAHADDASIGTSVSNFNGEKAYFTEDYLTQIDVETGEILFDRGISELLLANGYKDIAFGTSAPEFAPRDIYHLNDIEPALTDSEYWKKGDLFVSMRHRSLVFQYRPSNDSIVALIHGPFLNQHDVDFYSDHEVSIFNNNWVTEMPLSAEEMGESNLAICRCSTSKVQTLSFMTLWMEASEHCMLINLRRKRSELKQRASTMYFPTEMFLLKSTTPGSCLLWIVPK